MPARIDIPPGTVFGRLTVIEEASPVGRKRMMHCQCECGKQTVTALSKLRSGLAKSCGCWRWEINLATASRSEIPLYGKIAAGRVAMIDEDDFELVAPYRWNVREQRKDGRLVAGPYVVTSLSRRDHGGKAPTLQMHTLIMGELWVDHVDGNPLNNMKSNLRLATPAQNAHNRRMKMSGESQYKGVALQRASGRWVAHIGYGGAQHYLGIYTSELSAAYAYDMAAREHHGEFAFTNFEAVPPQGVLDAWQAEDRELWTSEHRAAQAARAAEQMRTRKPETRICEECGGEYESRALRSKYCSRKCSRVKEAEQAKERRKQQREGTLF